jgi:hypothetical protein
VLPKRPVTPNAYGLWPIENRTTIRIADYPTDSKDPKLGGQHMSTDTGLPGDEPVPGVPGLANAPLQETCDIVLGSAEEVDAGRALNRRGDYDNERLRTALRENISYTDVPLPFPR